VAFHGVGLNVSTDLQHFELILPCGLQDTRMTSLEREFEREERGPAPRMPEVKAALAASFAAAFEHYDWTLPQRAAGEVNP
ncbi:MAG: lipoyl(octanoyl) transferase LipB, partial [Deinococcus sp.]